jgi:hypothetical protein
MRIFTSKTGAVCLSVYEIVRCTPRPAPAPAPARGSTTTPSPSPPSVRAPVLGLRCQYLNCVCVGLLEGVALRVLTVPYLSALCTFDEARAGAPPISRQAVSHRRGEARRGGEGVGAATHIRLVPDTLTAGMGREGGGTGRDGNEDEVRMGRPPVSCRRWGGRRTRMRKRKLAQARTPGEDVHVSMGPHTHR